jgi:hypothetical protein
MIKAAWDSYRSMEDLDHLFLFFFTEILDEVMGRILGLREIRGCVVRQVFGLGCFVCF